MTKIRNPKPVLYMILRKLGERENHDVLSLDLNLTKSAECQTRFGHLILEFEIYL